MQIRSRLAVFFGKLACSFIHRLGRGNGSTFPGVIAKKIDPDILSVLSGMVRKQVIAVTGTNGKTTANNILYHTLSGEGEKVVCNKMGANLMEGVITAFVLGTDRWGRLDADYACIEVDELSCVKIFRQLKPDCILVTNLFRDQLDRTGEIDLLRARMQDAMRLVPQARLVINCDDICSVTLGMECINPVLMYGINEKIDEGIPVGARESPFCPFCGRRLVYEFIQYGQLGEYYCPACGRRRPCPDVTAEDIEISNGGYTYTLDGMRMEWGACAPYNIYNTLSAYAALCAADAPRKKFCRLMRSFDYGNKREGVFSINEARVELFLAKNPVGFQQKLFLILKDPKPKDVVIQINDTRLDGEDVSWLWDVDYQYLAGANAETITAGGARRDDMVLCLKYGDIQCGSTADLRETMEILTEKGSKNVYIITNYSGLYSTNLMLDQMQSAWKEGMTS